jgi:hypothetical protein
LPGASSESLMATSTIVIAVFACLFILVAVTITLQQIEKANAKRGALIATLKGQTRNFQQLLEGFPEGFLSRDLKLLVCQCIGEGLDQLVRIDRGNQQHAQMQRQLADRVAQLQAQPADQSQYQALNPAQMQELQKLLNSLYNVVQRLYQNKRLNAAQAESYSKQVQRLSTRLGLDTHLNVAQQALGERKLRLAIHHYGQAIDKMSKDNSDGSFTAQIDAYRQRCQELEALDQQMQKQQQASSATNAEWKSLEPKEDLLQKKNVYD